MAKQHETRLNRLEKRHPRPGRKVFVQHGDALIDTGDELLTREQLDEKFPGALVIRVRRWAPGDEAAQNDLTSWDDAPDESPDDPNWIDP